METLALRKQFSMLEMKSNTDGEFSGYASTYSKDVDGDRIEPGAFAGSIKDRKGRIPIFLNHDKTQWAGSSVELSEDGKGLYMRARLFLDTTAGRDAYGLMKNATALDFPVGLSIGFLTKDWEYEEASNTRRIKEVDLWETSITPFPANRQARVDEVKALRYYERLLRDVGGCSVNGAKAVLAMLPLTLSGDPESNSPALVRDVRDVGVQTLRDMRQQWKDATHG